MTILDADSNYLSATTSNGQWWTEVGAITQAAPNVISITKNLTVQNNDGSSANTDQFTWVGEIRRYPQGGSTTYDVLSTVTETVNGKDLGSGVYVVDVRYSAAGQILEIELGNNTRTIYTYDPNSLRLTQLVTKNAQNQSIQDFSYSYDSVGNIRAISDAVNTATQSFQYDALNRLIYAQGSYGAKFYQYDQIGNIIQKDNLTFTYGQNGAGPHAVTSLSNGTTFQYDANGNMKKKTDANGAVWDYLYDTENRLTEVKKNSATQAKFYYDGDGGRVKRVNYDNNSIAVDDNVGLFDVSKFSYAKNLTINSIPATVTTTTRYVGSLYEVSGSAPTRYIYFGDTRVAQVQSGQVVYYHGDHLGGTNIVTNNSGVVKELCEYLPFGGFARHEKYGNSAETAHFYFTGKQLDEKTGLYYYGARYYDPIIGRFVTPDTVVPSSANPQALNRYSYVYNCPLNYTDPSGNFPWLVIGAIIGAISGGISAYNSGGNVWQGALLGGLMGGLSGATLGASAEALKGIGQGIFLLKGSAATGLASQVASAAGAQDLSRHLGYAAMGMAATFTVWNVGRGVRDWIHESRFRIVDGFGRNATPVNGSHVHVNGVTTEFGGAIQEAFGKVGADYLAYNPTSGAIADLTESLLGKLTFTSSISRQVANSISELHEVTLSGFSQGGIIASNAALNLGLRGQRDVLKHLTVGSTQVSQARVLLSGAIGGLDSKHILYKTGVWDFSNFLAPNLNLDSFTGGVVGTAILPVGIQNHYWPY